MKCANIFSDFCAVTFWVYLRKWGDNNLIIEPFLRNSEECLSYEIVLCPKIHRRELEKEIVMNSGLVRMQNRFPFSHEISLRMEGNDTAANILKETTVSPSTMRVAWKAKYGRKSSTLSVRDCLPHCCNSFNETTISFIGIEVPIASL
jgi:hypothetical protein